MFKFSKYFFIVFLVVTVLPIAIMFAWSHYEISQDIQKREENFLEIGCKQLELSSKELLKNKRTFVEKTFQNIPKGRITFKQYKNLFNAEDAFLVNLASATDENLKAKTGLDTGYLKSVNTVTSTYSLIKENPPKKNELVVMSVIPLSYNKRLILVDQINWDDLFPRGPFKLQVYSGDKVENSALLKVVYDRFSPFVAKNNKMNNGSMPEHGMQPHGGPGMHEFDGKPMGMMKDDKRDFEHADRDFMHPPKDEVEVESSISKNLFLKNGPNKTIATLNLKLNMHRKTLLGSEMHEISLLILGTGVFLSLFAGFYIKKNFIAPFIVLSEASKKLKNGETDFQVVSEARHSEVKDTIKVFNSMIEGLREKDELRRSFVTNLTHDLKTPLIAQERAIELIIQEFEDLGLEDQLRLAKGLNKNNKHLLRMVNLILNSYRFDSENVNIIISDVELHNLIEQCYEQLKTLAEEKNITLVNNIPADFAVIKADSASIKRVMLNLIANAIDNIPAGCTVEVKGFAENDNVKIIVEDNGTGVSPVDLNHLFDRYYTGKSDERKLGSGLGLYVCKKLIELHNGKIEVESEVNHFTRFTIELPV